MSFTKQVLISMVAGIFVGLIINFYFISYTFIESFLIGDIFSTISSLFLILLKMIVLPLIFVSIVSGIISINDVSTLGRIGIKTISLYIFTTIIAISLALITSSLVNYNLGDLVMPAAPVTNITTSSNTNIILSFFPENFFSALANGNVIQVLVFAIFIGISSSIIKEEIPEFIKLIDNLNKVFNKLVLLIIKLTPIAVFCLLGKTFATQGIDVFIPLLKYFMVVAGVLLFHFFFTYSVLL